MDTNRPNPSANQDTPQQSPQPQAPPVFIPTNYTAANQINQPTENSAIFTSPALNNQTNLQTPLPSPVISPNPPANQDTPQPGIVLESAPLAVQSTSTSPQTIIANSETPSKLGGIKQHIPKIIIASLLIVIAYELYIGVKSIMSQRSEISPQGEPTVVVIQGDNAKLSLASSKKEYSVGEAINVKVLIDTANFTAQAVDVEIKYDTNHLEADALTKVLRANLFPDYPVTAIHPDQGIIKISATNGLSDTGFKGIGELASFTLKAKAPGATTLLINSAPNNTADSNILDLTSRIDVLKTVENLNITIN